MHRHAWRLGGLIVALTTLILPPPFAHGRAGDQLGAVRLPFITNQGQVDARVAYYVPTFAGTLFVTRRGELVYSLKGEAGWSLTETLVGGHARPRGRDRSPAGVSLLLGADRARWRAALPTWEQVDLGEVWPGVGVALRAQGRTTEKVFTVRPGGRVAGIRMRVAGAEALAVDASGALVARTGRGPVTFTAPVAYQDVDGARRPVRVAYRTDGFEYGFAVGAHDPARPLVIDPLLQSTYLGGEGVDSANAIAIHPATGDVYVAGSTESTRFPGTAGGAQPTFGGGRDDAFIARFSSTLTTLIQATYLGGSGRDLAFALAIHPTTGDVYVGGATGSSNFPGTAGGAQPTFRGGPDPVGVLGDDGFVARLPRTLTSLTQATYLGGSASEQVNGLAIHPTTGDVYVTGTTRSGDFPGTAAGAQPTFPAAGDSAFVARLPSTLTALTQATYLGGDFLNQGNAIAIHPTTGDVYVAGATGAFFNFPGTAGGAQPTLTGPPSDAFIARFSATLTTLIQATYLGGFVTDVAKAIAIHPTTGDVYVAGFTAFNDLPGTLGGAQPATGGGTDGFVARLPSTLTTFTRATYLGGSGNDEVNALAIHPTTGEVYVAGSTGSNPFPGTAGGAQPEYAGAIDAFVARLTSDLAASPASPAVPTLSGWALIAMIALLLMTGVLAVRRRRWAR